MTCEWGSSELCGRPATWIIHHERFPSDTYACDEHAPKMATADQAHRLSHAPPMPLDALRDYVTALAWRSILLRDSDRFRYEIAHSKFQSAAREYYERAAT